jgi:hypothetical protein
MDLAPQRLWRIVADTGFDEWLATLENNTFFRPGGIQMIIRLGFASPSS